MDIRVGQVEFCGPLVLGQVPVVKLKYQPSALPVSVTFCKCKICYGSLLLLFMGGIILFYLDDRSITDVMVIH